MRKPENITLTNRAGLVITNDTVTMSVAALDLLLSWAREQAERGEDARVGKLLAAMDWVADPFVDGTTPLDEVLRRIRFMLEDRDRAMLSAAPKEEPDHG